MTVRAFFGSLALFAAACLASTIANAGCVLGKLADLPAAMNGGHPEVVGKINGRDARFIVDSGAFFSVISPGTATEYKLALTNGPEGLYMTGVGGSASISTTKVKTLTLAGFDLHNMLFIVGGSESGAAGMLGQSLLHIADVEYDLAHGKVALLQPKGCAGVTLAHWAAGQPLSVLPLQANDRLSHTVAIILVNGQKVRAIFDTGAPASILSLPAAARAGIRPDSPGVEPAGYTGGLGKRMTKIWNAPVEHVTIGGEELRRTRLLIGDIGEDTDMLLGADFFLAHHVYVANSQSRIFFTYNGGPVFAAARNTALRAVYGAGKHLDLPKAPDGPSDAETLSRRGMASAARGDLPAALADLDRAVADAPREPRYLIQRADARLRAGDRAGAEADLDQALALKPDEPQALLRRAGLRTQAKRRDAAVADLEAVDRLLDPASDLRSTVGSLYLGLQLPEKALSQFDRWIAAHPVDSGRPMVLNAACWARALLGRELARALADCTTALRLIPHKEVALDSRGLVNLRRGDMAAAIKDYDAALAIAPKQAWSLYGRGLARLRLGEREAGEKDLAAADAADPSVREDAARYGITP